MAARKLVVAGISVDRWTKSFRINHGDAVSQIIYAPDMTDADIAAFMSVVRDAALDNVRTSLGIVAKITSAGNPDRDPFSVRRTTTVRPENNTQIIDRYVR